MARGLILAAAKAAIFHFPKSNNIQKQLLLASLATLYKLERERERNVVWVVVAENSWYQVNDGLHKLIFILSLGTRRKYHRSLGLTQSNRTLRRKHHLHNTFLVWENFNLLI